MVSILITGGTGFIGIPLVKRLHELGHKLKLLVRENSNITHFNDLADIEYVIGDVRDIESLNNAINDIDIIYHLAAYTGIWAKKKSLYYDINVKGTENILSIVLGKDIKMFYISSFTALGPTPSEPVDEKFENEKFCMEYEKSKCEAKKLVKEYIPKGLNVAIFYPGIVYGPGDFNIFGRMLYDIMRGKILPLGLCPGKGESIACFSYLNDLVDCLVDVIDKDDIYGEDFILGGENVKFVDYLNLIATIARDKKVKKIPMWIAKFYALLLEIKSGLTRKTPFLTRAAINAIKYHRSYSSDKAINKLNYKITPLREGLEETIKWYKDYSESN
ncbi:MAG: NAD-dependent epimerase/dehydratase family protein [Candidatus Hermodarchaeota archaeon]